VVAAMALPEHDYVLEKLALDAIGRARADAARYRRAAEARAQEDPMTAREAAHAFIDAWNARSPDAVRAVFAADGRLIDPSAPDGLAGPAIAASVQRTLERFTDLSFALTSLLEGDAGRIAFEWVMRGALAAPDGRRIPVTLNGCDVCQVRDGKIVELRGYFDRSRIAALVDGGAEASRLAVSSVAASAG
jgi:ketosteroid isomerase-like protein